MAEHNETVLQVNDLNVKFSSQRQTVCAVNGISFSLKVRPAPARPRRRMPS